MSGGVEFADFDLAGDLPARDWHLLEASAGTGKTYSLTALVARFVVESSLRPEQLLMVTFTRAAAAEMKYEVRQQLLAVRAALSASTDADVEPWMERLRDCDPVELDARIGRVDAAISGIDGATITTIHGFFQQALIDLGLRSGDAGTSVAPTADSSVAAQVVRDHLIATFAADPEALGRGSKSDPSSIESQLHKSLKAVAQNSSAVLDPHSDTGDAAFAIATMVGELRDEVKAVRAERGVVDFNDIIERLLELLDDPEVGPALADSLRARYRLVLIDEFQDTDAEQWRLFTKVFAMESVPDDFLGLIAVGDPKQAIYRFRGADIDAYLAAATGDRMTKWRLAQNHRTDRPLVEAINTWLDGDEFGHEAIAYQRVTTPERNATSRLVDAGAPLQFRHLREEPKDHMGSVRRAIAVDVADHVERLVEAGRIVVGRVSDGVDRAVTHRDICVLVRGHADADPIFDEFRRRGIPAVRSRIGSVFASEATEQLRILLSALAAPSDQRRVLALELSWFAADPFAEVVDLAALSPEAMEELRGERIRDLQRWASRQATELQRRGLIGWFQELRIEPEVVDQITDGADALRRLTDLEHLIELLNTALQGRHAPAGTVLRALDGLLSSADEDVDEQKRRIDTDHDVVQITSMHSSKGLEYPIVLLPYVKDVSNSTRRTYKPEGSDVRYVDVAHDIAWKLDGLTQDDRKSLDKVEATADELRILYVAITRAKHQLIVWWGRPPKTKNGSTELFNGAMGRILFDGMDLKATTPVLSDDAVAEKLRALVEEIGEAADYVVVERRPEPDTDLPFAGRPATIPIEPATFPDRPVERDGWYRWSYTSISNGVRSDNEGDPHGGSDEHNDAVGDAAGPRFEGELVSIAGSNVFGSWVHDLMEHLDFADADLGSVTAAVEASGRAAAFGSADQIARGLLAVIDTPLDSMILDLSSPPLDIRLRDVARNDRLAEMEFHFPLGSGDPVALRDVFSAAAASASPFREYFERLAEGERLVEVRGLLTGSIDAVLRVPSAGGGKRFTIVDYKTNRLHPVPAEANDSSAPIASYAGASMAQAMEHGDYPLQVLVYNVALHRLLSTRLPGYDIDTHLGPTLYLFVRGMIGAETPVLDGVRNGVFAWRPESTLIVEASRILGGRR